MVPMSVEELAHTLFKIFQRSDLIDSHIGLYVDAAGTPEDLCVDGWIDLVSVARELGSLIPGLIRT